MSSAWALPGVLIAALARLGWRHAAARARAPAALRRRRARRHRRRRGDETGTQPAAVKGPAIVKVSRSRLGSILVDASGRTLYLFRQDKPGRPLCTSDYLNCTTMWPPLMTTGPPRGEAGIKSRLLGVLHRTKPAGSQVTYNGHPLYLLGRRQATRRPDGAGDVRLLVRRFAQRSSDQEAVTDSDRPGGQNTQQLETR